MATLTPLPHFGFIEITGRDAIKFMQGYTTCDVERMTPATSRIGAVCNIQGRMVASALIARTEDGLLLRLSQDLIEPVMDFLKKYIVFSKAEMANVSDAIRSFGITGALADAPGAAGTVRISQQQRLVSLGGERFELWIDADATLPELEDGSLEDWTAADIEDGVAWITAATTEEFIPQMFDYHRLKAVDFDKGCYLGQEIVARMQYRGNVNRKLFRGHGPGLRAGDPVRKDGKTVGRVVAASGDRVLAVIQSKDDSIPDVDGLNLEAIERE